MIEVTLQNKRQWSMIIGYSKTALTKCIRMFQAHDVEFDLYMLDKHKSVIDYYLLYDKTKLEQADVPSETYKSINDHKGELTHFEI